MAIVLVAMNHHPYTHLLRKCVEDFEAIGVVSGSLVRHEHVSAHIRQAINDFWVDRRPVLAMLHALAAILARGPCCMLICAFESWLSR